MSGVGDGGTVGTTPPTNVEKDAETKLARAEEKLAKARRKLKRNVIEIMQLRVKNKELETKLEILTAANDDVLNQNGAKKKKGNVMTKDKCRADPKKLGISCPWCEQATTFTEATLRKYDIKKTDLEWDDKGAKWVYLGNNEIPSEFRRIGAWKKMRRHFKNAHPNKTENDYPPSLQQYTTKLRADMIREKEHRRRNANNPSAIDL